MDNMSDINPYFEESVMFLYLMECEPHTIGLVLMKFIVAFLAKSETMI